MILIDNPRKIDHESTRKNLLLEINLTCHLQVQKAHNFVTQSARRSVCAALLTKTEFYELTLMENYK